jgi:hypothetical protein
MKANIYSPVNLDMHRITKHNKILLKMEQIIRLDKLQKPLVERYVTYP